MSTTLECPIPWVEHRCTIACAPESAWRTFLDFNDWAPRRGICKGLTWTKGDPWKVGSCFSLDLLIPQPIQVTGRITLVEAPGRLGWISHGNGVTDVHFLDFLPLGADGVLVKGSGQFTGTPREDCRPSRDENHFQAYAWLYEHFSSECEARAKGMKKQPLPPASA